MLRKIGQQSSGNKIFQSKIKLVRHIETNHINKKIFKCTFENCNKEFNKKAYLLKHVKICNKDERPFTCKFSDCNKTYKTLDELRRTFFDAIFNKKIIGNQH